MVVRGPIARARSVVPVPVRPSGTQRVPECVCVKLREYSSLTLARVMLHCLEYSIYGHVLLYGVYWGCSRGCYCRSHITEEGIPVLAVMHEDPEISDTVCISPLFPRTKTVQWLIDAPSITLTNIGITEV